MKLPSVQQILHDARRTFLRFPFVLINAVIGTVSAVILVDHEGPAQATILFNILLATILGIPLLTGLVLLSEKRKWRRGMALGLQLVGILLLVAYAYSVPSDLWEAPAIHILRLLLIAVALHLFVAFAPYASPGEINGFWHYNKILLLRLFITMIYTVVFYAGLALALAALDNLFGLNIPGKRYAELWFILLGIFTTWSFLAGISENLDQLEESNDYPQVIKIFAQYILFPLVLIYLVILYAYLAKILISWDWPQGWVSRLILGFATSGIFSLLLLYPVRDRAENIWIKTASRWFYLVMIPVVVMLFLALWRRISEYGFTEGRYIAIVLGLWLGGIVLYYILSKIKSIKVIPISLCVIALIISFGPWGVFSISEKSQVNRLQEFLTSDRILVDGLVQKAPEPVAQDDIRQISSILAYLHDIHGYQRIQPWFRESLNEDSTGVLLRYKEPALVAKMIGIEYENIWYNTAGNDIWLRSNRAEVIDVQGYERMIRGQHISSRQHQKVFIDQDFTYRVNSDLDIITFIFSPEENVRDSLQVDFHPLINQLFSDYPNINVSNIAADKMMQVKENQNLKVKIFFRYIKLHKDKGLVKPVEYDVDILYNITKK